jgi:hypothetical protein
MFLRERCGAATISEKLLSDNGRIVIWLRMHSTKQLFMKGFIFLFVFFLLAGNAYSQQPGSTKMMEQQKKDLMAKSRVQKTVGWIMFGTGLPVVISCVYLLSEFDSNDISVNEVKTVLVASVVYTGLSIPLIIAGRRNKAKALSLSVTMQRVEVPRLYTMQSIRQLALALRIPIK